MNWLRVKAALLAVGLAVTAASPAVAGARTRNRNV